MNNFYCAAPWRGLHINISGDVKTCCAGNPNMLGNINNKSIEEILNGDKLKEIQASLKKGESHPYCTNCTDRESKGGDSERSWHNSVNENFDFANTPLQYEFPSIVDVRWNNTCNLSCNYCAPGDSSKWAGLKKLSVNTQTRHYYTEVCDFIEKHYNQVKEVALVGGEPLLLPENERLLDVIPPNCRVTLITNLSNPLENNKIFNKLSKRNNVGWAISFDNIEDRFEYVRYGSNWKLIVHNIELIQSLMISNKHYGGIHAVYNLYNATRLCELKNFAKEKNLTIRWQNLSGPNALDPRMYGQDITKAAANEIEKFFSLYNIDPMEKMLFESVLIHYKASPPKSTIEKLEKLKLFVNDIETKYHPDKAGEFARLWPEFGELLWPQNQH